MATEAQKLILKTYARRVREALRAHPENTEPGLAPEFHRMLVELLATLPAAPTLTVLPEFRHAGVGRPDIALKRAGSPARAFIELKAKNKRTDGASWRDAHDKRQFRRFSEFAQWAICNFHEFRYYEREEAIAHAALVPERALDPNRDDARADRLIDEHDPDAALALIERLAQAQSPEAQNARHLAQLLAHSARLVRGIVEDRLAQLEEDSVTDAPLQQVREEFRRVLYSRPEAAGMNAAFDTLFSSAFAQTLAFGLLLVREATGETVDRHAYEHMPDEHPLMRSTLRVLSTQEVADEIGAGFEVMLDTVNCLRPLMLKRPARGRDPILYFYEDFLETFDPEARERFGVYYTPVEVVRYMVGALDRALRENLEVDGLADERVHILDPAVGTGTFLLGVAERVRERVEVSHGPGQVPAALRGLMARAYGFELLVGPYAVAHYRLHAALTSEIRALGADDELPRLGVYLTDTLAEPNAAAPLGALGFVTEAIRDERVQSNRIKTEQPILAIIGNPPYRRLLEGEDETLVGRWLDGLWDDLKQPVRDAGWGGELNTFPEMSVAFWRWSLWKLFEASNAPQRGVVALISNRKYLTGKPYAGLRKMLRERFDRIEVIDLRGDLRMGERAGIEDDQGVFNIQVGTAITVAIADGSKVADEPADIFYTDVWAHNLTARRAKLDWLERHADSGGGDGGLQIERALLDDMRPRPFLNGDLLSLRDCFSFSRSGVQTKRDDFVYAITRDQLSNRIQSFVANRPTDAAFAPTSAKPLASARAQRFSDAAVVLAAYRPLDRRYLYNHNSYIDRRRRDLQQVWGRTNVGFYAMPRGTGEGPGLWCHGLLPDYHSFRGSYGGYALPLYDCREGHGPYNLKPALVAALTDAYGVAVTPEQVFDTILCLLSARSYTRRFAEDLEDVFPHVPFPSSPDVFAEAGRVGAEIRAVETFARLPAEPYRQIARAETAPRGPLAPIEQLVDNGFALCADGSGRIANVPQEVWAFAVSGYRVLSRWLAAREGMEIGPNLIPEMRDVAQRIAELLFLFRESDRILDATLADSLTREALGVAAGEALQDDEQD